MNLLLLKELFYKAIPEPRPEECQVEDIVSPLRSLSRPNCLQLLEYVPVIWPISSTLCCTYINRVESLRSRMSAIYRLLTS